MTEPSTAQPRGTYRHGDLRQALIVAGIELARDGGPDAVVLRESTRRAGVSPNAAYRHFADRRALLGAVSASAQGMVADSMLAEIAALRLPDSATAHDAAAYDTAADDAAADDAAADARRRLRAVGTGYLGFARREPGLFRTAFSVPDDLANSGDAAKAGAAGLTPFQVLGTTLDALVAAGVLPADRRPGAELHAWSAVHGLGMLIIDGPLRGLTPEMMDGAAVRLLDMVDRGI